MFLQIESNGPVQIWTIRRPNRGNGLGTTLANELWAACQALTHPSATSAHEAIGALVLAAELAGKPEAPVWVAGGDLKELGSIGAPGQGGDYALTMGKVCHFLSTAPLAVIAAVTGRAIGGGAELAMAADIRIGTFQATFEFRQFNMGLSTGYGSAARLVGLIGKAKAQECMYLQQVLDGATCRTLGLLHDLAATSEKALEQAKAIAATLTGDQSAAFRAQKVMFADAPGRGRNFPQGEIDTFAAIWGNPAHQKALKSFGDSRAPSSSAK